MTRLDLVKELIRLSGLTSQMPSSTISQPGLYGRAVGHIDAAYEEIQSLYLDWSFLWASSSFTTTAGIAHYVGASDLNAWGGLYLDGVPIRIYDWPDGPDLSDAQGIPIRGFIRPDNRIELKPIPDGAYQIDFEYYRKPSAMTEDAHEPLIPSQFQRIIVARALVMLANFEAAEELKAQGMEMYQTYLTALQDHQLTRRRSTHGRMESAQITVIPE